MKRFWQAIISLLLAIGLFFGVVAVMGAVNNRGVIEEMKSWGNAAIEETVEDETPADEIVEDTTVETEQVA